MRVLITGGAGFMGSNAIRYFLKKYSDIEIVNLDKLTYAGNPDNLKDIENNSRYRFIKGDIIDRNLLDNTVKDVDVIINYAAETHVDRSILDPKEFIVTDVLGTYSLLESAKKHNIKKYIQISTDEVFGSIQDGKFTEESPFKPNSPYAASKAGGDHLCRAYFKTYDMPIIVTHSCNFFGPYQYPEKLIPLFITNLLENKKIPVYGDGLQAREWISTQDHCQAVDLILQKGKAGEVYNISTGDEIKNIEITKLLLAELNKNDSFIDYVKDRPGHDRRYAIDATKLRVLGWSPKMNFNDGIKQTIEWYKNNEGWWKKIKSGEYLKYYKQQYAQT